MKKDKTQRRDNQNKQQRPLDKDDEYSTIEGQKRTSRRAQMETGRNANCTQLQKLPKPRPIDLHEPRGELARRAKRDLLLTSLLV